MTDKEDQPKPSLYKRLSKKRWFLPLISFISLVIIFLFTSRFTDRPPVIDSITPKVGFPGNVMVIQGKNFGSTRDGAEVTIAGIRPTTSSYIEWNDNRINIRIPDDAGSGMVYVTTRSGRSNGILFTNQTHIPVLVSQIREPGHPYIEEITPSKAPVGSLLLLRGYNFGNDQDSGKVLFTQSSQDDTSGDSSANPLQTLEASELDSDYESWTDREIRVRVPDGASSGSIKVLVGKIQSNSLYFEVTEEAGSKVYTDKRGFQINYSIEASNFKGQPNNSIDFWLPLLVSNLEQRNIELVSEPKPLWDNYRGMMRYRFENVNSDSVIALSQTFWFDRYAVHSRILPQAIPLDYDKERRLYKQYTAPDPLIPATDPKIIQAARTAGKRERNPYTRARNIYLYLLQRLSYDPKVPHENLSSLLDSRKADSYGYTFLFCALLRAAEIPARPVSGYLVYGNKEIVRHYWTELYFENFGWFPVDPLLGDGVTFDSFPQVEGPQEYYFGSLDNQHITFSKGLAQLKPLEPSGVVRRRDGILSLQTFHEETVNLEEYTSLWRDLRIIDWW